MHSGVLITLSGTTQLSFVSQETAACSRKSSHLDDRATDRRLSKPPIQPSQAPTKAQTLVQQRASHTFDAKCTQMQQTKGPESHHVNHFGHSHIHSRDLPNVITSHVWSSQSTSRTLPKIITLAPGKDHVKLSKLLFYNGKMALQTVLTLQLHCLTTNTAASCDLESEQEDRARQQAQR